MADRLTRQGLRDLGGNGGPRRRERACLPGEHEFRATHRTREVSSFTEEYAIEERLYECRFCREEDWR